MSRRRAPSVTSVAIAVLTAATTFFTLLSWDGLADDASAFLVPLFWICGGLAVLGLLLRAAGTATWLVPVVQLLAVAFVLHHHWAGGWIPTAESLTAVGELLDRSLQAAARHPAPVPMREPAFPAVMLGIGALVALAVELCVGTLRRVPLAGLPLLAAFTVPVSLLDGVAWSTFALASGSFVLLLAADQADRLGHWGRSLGASDRTLVDTQPRQVRLGTLWPTATRVGAAGVGVAVLTPLLLPATDGLLPSADGSGSGDGGSSVRIDNPFLNLKRDLTRDDDIPLVRVETDDPAPAYLRFAVLDEFTGVVWQPSQLDRPDIRAARGRLPTAPGLDPATPRTEREWSISVTEEFESSWLPLPYPPSAVQVAGDWRYDEDTLDVVSMDNDLSTAGLSYEAVGLELQPEVADLVTSATPPRRILLEGTELPASTPDSVEQLALEVTEGARSAFERAVMLQEWFRSDGGFTYSLEPGRGSGLEQLEHFLGTEEDSRRGYCEQFAAAMTMMSRTLGIPARIAVGFLRPDLEGSEWVFSSDDLHAWPELYFEGTGWVRFEPTPRRRAEQVPSYTRGRVPVPEELPTPDVSPSAELPSPSVSAATSQDASTAASGDGAVPGWLLVSAVLVLVAALACSPRLLREWRRRDRLFRSEPEDLAEGAWAEVRATAIDLGLGWDDGATLRRRAWSLAPRLAPQRSPADPDPVAALQALVLVVERARYSATGLSGAPEPRDRARGWAREWAQTVTAAMRAAAGDAARRRATWWPASLWRSAPAVHGARGSAQAAAHGAGDVDRVSL